MTEVHPSHRLTMANRHHTPSCDDCKLLVTSPDIIDTCKGSAPVLTPQKALAAITAGDVLERKNTLLLDAAKQFEFYAANHQKKADDLSDAARAWPLSKADAKVWEEVTLKAATNRAWARRLREEAES